MDRQYLKVQIGLTQDGGSLNHTDALSAFLNDAIEGADDIMDVRHDIEYAIDELGKALVRVREIENQQVAA